MKHLRYTPGKHFNAPLLNGVSIADIVESNAAEWRTAQVSSLLKDVRSTLAPLPCAILADCLEDSGFRVAGMLELLRDIPGLVTPNKENVVRIQILLAAVDREHKLADSLLTGLFDHYTRRRWPAGRGTYVPTGNDWLDRIHDPTDADLLKCCASWSWLCDCVHWLMNRPGRHGYARQYVYDILYRLRESGTLQAVHRVFKLVGFDISTMCSVHAQSERERQDSNVWAPAPRLAQPSPTFRMLWIDRPPSLLSGYNAAPFLLTGVE